ncbi:hypothetical protein GDO86_007916 [Hymenochirus boettgeri]|uniref:Tctex1 domain-containing protein 4 n=1 Tax=Hymenochirus boettgeri TaxID=247094 RepID=A0A8T2J2V8_9PIPI|nr:hypothetical protein GDO86_007916 [Hymenochirus boettgeri]
MAGQSAPLSEEILAQFNKNEAAEGGGSSRTRAASFSTRRSSHSVDMSPRTLLRLRSIDERLPILSRRSSIVSNMNLPFSRKNSVCAMVPGKYLSLGPWAHYGRVSFSGLPLYQPVKEIQYENTYKTGPEDGCRFPTCKIKKVLETTLNSYLADTKYMPMTCGQLALSLSDFIRNKLKDLIPSRYKLICNVFLGQMGNQGFMVASRSLLDTNNFVSAAYANSSLFAVAIAHGIYYE